MITLLAKYNKRESDQLNVVQLKKQSVAFKNLRFCLWSCLFVCVSIQYASDGNKYCMLHHRTEFQYEPHIIAYPSPCLVKFYESQAFESLPAILAVIKIEYILSKKANKQDRQLN